MLIRPFGSRATPIYQTSSFVFKDANHAAALVNLECAGHVYSRISNPTNAVLEGGVAGIAIASGQATMHLGLATIAGAGSHIVASRALYGRSRNLLSYRLKRFRIEITFVDPSDLNAWRAVIRPNTKVLFGGTFGNPGLDVLDIPRIAAFEHERYLPLMVDSIFTTPYLLGPVDHSADLIFQSATKFLCGHSTSSRRLAGGRWHFSEVQRPCGKPINNARLASRYCHSRCCSLSPIFNRIRRMRDRRGLQKLSPPMNTWL